MDSPGAMAPPTALAEFRNVECSEVDNSSDFYRLAPSESWMRLRCNVYALFPRFRRVVSASFSGETARKAS